MVKQSAGLLLFRRTHGRLEVLLGHPGGPFWQGRETGAWTIPKGGVHPGEEPLTAAIREFREETGFEASPPFIALGTIVQRSGKVVHSWAFEGDCDPSSLVSVHCTTEWPPRSGRYIDIPEIDRGAFFDSDEAKRLINPGQSELIDRLVDALKQP